MKRYLVILLVILTGILLAACGLGNRQSVKGLVSRSDRIGQFTYTTAEAGQFTPLWELDCITAGEGISSECTARVDQKVNISAGVFADPNGQSLDEKWATQDYSVTIAQMPVDLQSFGFVELEHPVVGTIRMWNVVVSTKKPGSLTYVETGTIGENTMNYITTINFVSTEE